MSAVLNRGTINEWIEEAKVNPEVAVSIPTGYEFEDGSTWTEADEENYRAAVPIRKVEQLVDAPTVKEVQALLDLFNNESITVFDYPFTETEMLLLERTETELQHYVEHGYWPNEEQPESEAAQEETEAEDQVEEVQIEKVEPIQIETVQPYTMDVFTDLI